MSKRMIGLGLLGVSAVILLSGCNIPRALPDEERYQYINAVKEDLDYASAGEVVSDGYDKGDGILSPSYFKATVNGENSFELLQNNIESIKNIDCQTVAPVQLRCYAEQAIVTLSRDSETDTIVQLRITDSSGGR